MENLLISGYIKSQKVKERLLKPFSNKRGDDSGNEAGRGAGKILSLVVLILAGVAFLGFAVSIFNGGMTGLKSAYDQFKTITPTAPTP